MKPLSTKQKAVICQIASKAYHGMGAALGFDDVTTFRHACVFDVCCKNGLTACDQRDYINIYNYFADLLGTPHKVDNTPSAWDRAVWMLQQAMQQWGMSDKYVISIAMDRLHLQSILPPDKLTPLLHRLGVQGVRQLTYTIINRGRAAKRKQQQ